MSATSLASVVDTARLLRGRLPGRRTAAVKRAPVASDVFTIAAPVAALNRVEAALRNYPAVRGAVVIERAERPAGRQLVAYLTARDGVSLPAASIRTHLLAVLPAELVPTTFVTLDVLPMLADGQPDYAALPSPDTCTLGMRHYEVPCGPVEKAIAAIWRELLCVDQVGRNAHFFELGGHSSLALQMVYRLGQDMQVSIPMRELFQEPVLHRYAAVVSQQMQSSRFLHATADDAAKFFLSGPQLDRDKPGPVTQG